MTKKKIKYRQNDNEVIMKILCDAMNSESFKQTYSDIESQQIFNSTAIHYVTKLIQNGLFDKFIECCNKVEDDNDLFNFINNYFTIISMYNLM